MGEIDLSFERVLGAVLRRKSFFLASFAAAAVAFGGAATRIPPRYKAAVVLTIEPGRYPNDFLRPNVIPGLDTRLGGMEKMLESAPVIEELRTRTGLAARDGSGSGILDAFGLASDAIESWRKSFEFEVLAGQTPASHRADEAVVVEMSFKHSDPDLAARVVNACAARANEENTRFRRAFVEEVVRFVRKEEERAQVGTREREDAWNAFKLASAEQLPEQEPYIVARLGQLRARYADLKTAERFSQARLEQLTSERGLLVAQIALVIQLASVGQDGDPTSPLELRRERLRLVLERDAREDEYNGLRRSFTEKTPQVQVAKDRLDATESRLRDVESKLGFLGIALGDVPAETKRAHPDPLDYDGKALGPSVPGGLPKVPVRIPGATPRLDGDGAHEPPPEKPKDSPKDSKEGKEAEKPAPVPAAVPESSGTRLVQVLSGSPLDEKVLEKQLEPLAYRLVVENPSYARIRGIDFALKETRESLSETARQREDAFVEIRKGEEHLAAVPAVRQRLETLWRALVEAREDFARLQNQLDNANKALAVENEGKGEQLRVIDFARPPSRPTGAGPALFVALALAAAVGAATGLCLVRDLRSATATPAPTPAASRPATPPAEPTSPAEPHSERKTDA